MKTAHKILLLDRSQTYAQVIAGLAPGNLIGLWPMNETSGTTVFDRSTQGNNGAYRDVSMVNKSTFANNQPCPQWTPANSDYANMYTNALRDDWLWTKGSLAIWMKVRASSVWSDGATRNMYDFRTATTGNIVSCNHPAANNNRMVWTIRIGGVSRTPLFDTPAGTRNDWILNVVTWADSANGDQAKVYYNDAQVSSTQTGFGAAGAGTLSSQYAIVGAVDNSTPAQFWDGYLAYLAVWAGYELTAADVANLYNSRFLA